ncbi:MAG: hypothetical protein HEEMFOPI_01228 [Holosporales bacterium]
MRILRRIIMWIISLLTMSSSSTFLVDDSEKYLKSNNELEITHLQH